MPRPTLLVQRLEGMSAGEVLTGDGVTVRCTKERWWYIEYGDHRANLITVASVVEQMCGSQLTSALGLAVPTQMTLW